MKILFVHQNFPGQYKYLAPALAAQTEHQVVVLGMSALPAMPGIHYVRYAVARGNTPSIHPWLLETETKVIRGEAAAQAAMTLRQQGFMPDIICAHPGWGEALFLRDVWPTAKILSFMEFYYRADGLDFNFDPEYPDETLEGRCRLRMKNANSLLNLENCDAGVSPTVWQQSTYPAAYHDRIHVIHDGIDTQAVCPHPDVSLTINQKIVLRPADEIITFVNRNLEPYRGFPCFMRALPEIQRRHPRARALIVGGNDVSYGAKPKDGVGYRQKLLEELSGQLDLSRIHFLGRIPYGQFVALMQLSTVHVYLTYPFVLSWSMLEAMSAGALVVGSCTAPVEEVIHHGKNGLLVDFFQPNEIVDAVSEVLRHPNRLHYLREAARHTICTHYDLRSVCLPQHLQLIQHLVQCG